MVSTCTADWRGCVTSSAQRMAGPPLGPFSSVNVARAVVGATPSNASALSRSAVTRARVAALADIVRNSILVVVIGFLGRASYRGLSNPGAIDRRQPSRGVRWSRQRREWGLGASRMRRDGATVGLSRIESRKAERGVTELVFRLDPARALTAT